ALTGLCNTCSSHASSYSSELADRTVLLTYAIDNRDGSEHQSAHHMRAYKGYRSTPVSPQCSTDLQLLIATTVEIHRPCVQSWLGAEWDSFTFVPSRERPDGSHPLAKLANRVQPLDSQKRELQKFALQPGPGSGARHKHTMTEDRFHVDPRWQHHVDGKNVLIVDDTWTTGSSAQGAAIAARRAGAATVTILCVDRWLRSDWPDHRNVIDSLSGPYDVLQCPVTGQVCPAAQHFAPSRLIPH
ncbi:hypothetical protein, partial [Nocardia farcinica]